MRLKQLIEDILRNRSCDYTIRRIAKETGLAESTIKRIKSGQIKEPRHKTAILLLSLYFTIQQRKNKLS